MKTNLINGVRICRAVLAAAAVALVAYAVVAGGFYFLFLAAGAAAAIFVKVRNVRLALAGIAAVEAMYFVADLLSPAGGSNLRDLLFAVSGAAVTVAILRLRHWESADETDLHPHIRLTAGTAGIILVISAALMAFAPVTSSQASGTGTNVQCGSVLIDRHLPTGWLSTLDMSTLRSQCDYSRHERMAFAIIQLEVGIGGIVVGRSALRRQPHRILFSAAAIVILAGGVGAAWASSSVHNANHHDEAFQPWFGSFTPQFVSMQTNNKALNDAIKNKDNNGVAAACTSMQANGDEMTPSIAAWPANQNDNRSAWQKFLIQYRADADSCVRSATSGGSASDVSNSEWFSDSSLTLGALRHTISYW